MNKPSTTFYWSVSASLSNSVLSKDTTILTLSWCYKKTKLKQRNEGMPSDRPSTAPSKNETPKKSILN